MVASGGVACTETKAKLPEYKKYASVTDVPKISVVESKAEVEAGTAVIVDSRDAVAYKHEHIQGSINIPSNSPATAFESVPKDKKIIVYCSCGAEGTSMKLAYDMNQAGIANTYAMKGGTAAWHSAGYPMEKGH
jgi:rhodanese-related sulfurtransferase